MGFLNNKTKNAAAQIATKTPITTITRTTTDKNDTSSAIPLSSKYWFGVTRRPIVDTPQLPHFCCRAD